MVSILVNETKIVRVKTLITSEVTRSIIACNQKAKRIPSYFTGYLGCIIRINDRSRMNCLQRCLENVDALEKERPLFFKEDWETLICRDDCFVSFNLCKVGIHRKVEGHLRANSILHGQARIKLNRCVNEASEIDERRVSGEHIRRYCRYALAGL